MKRWQRTLLGLVVGCGGVWAPTAAQEPPIVSFPNPPRAGRAVAVVFGQIRDQMATEIDVAANETPAVVRLPQRGVSRG